MHVNKISTPDRVWVWKVLQLITFIETFAIRGGVDSYCAGVWFWWWIWVPYLAFVIATNYA